MQIYSTVTVNSYIKLYKVV